MRAPTFRPIISVVLILASIVSLSAPAWALRQSGAEEGKQKKDLQVALVAGVPAPASPVPAPGVSLLMESAGAEENWPTSDHGLLLTIHSPPHKDESAVIHGFGESGNTVWVSLLRRPSVSYAQLLFQAFNLRGQKVDSQALIYRGKTLRVLLRNVISKEVLSRIWPSLEVPLDLNNLETMRILKSREVQNNLMRKKQKLQRYEPRRESGEEEGGLALSMKKGDWALLFDTSAEDPSLWAPFARVSVVEIGSGATQLSFQAPRSILTDRKSIYLKEGGQPLPLTAGAEQKSVWKSIPYAHAGTVVSMAASHDPSVPLFISAGLDDNVRIWGWDTGLSQRVYMQNTPHNGLKHPGVRAVDFTTNSRGILTVSLDAVLRREMFYGRGTSPRLPLTGITVRPDELYPDSITIGPRRLSVAVTGEEATAVIVHNLDEKREGIEILWALQPADGTSPLSVAFHPGADNTNPDGPYIVFGTAGGNVEVFDLRGGAAHPARRVGNLEPHEGKVLAVDFSPDGYLLATGDDQGTVRLWDAGQIASGKFVLLHELKVDQGQRILRMELFPECRVLATAAESGKVHFWDTETGVEFASPTFGEEIPVHSLTFRAKEMFSPRKPASRDPFDQTVALGLADGSVRFLHARFELPKDFPGAPVAVPAAALNKQRDLAVFDAAVGVALYRHGVQAYVVAETPTDARNLIELGVDPGHLVGLLWAGLKETDYRTIPRGMGIRVFVSGDPSKPDWKPGAFESIRQLLGPDREVVPLFSLQSLAPALRRLRQPEALISNVFQAVAEAARTLEQMK